MLFFFFFFQAEDGIRDGRVTGVQTCALPIYEAFLVLLELGDERSDFLGDELFRGLADQPLIVGEFGGSEDIFGTRGFQEKARSEERRVGKECRSRWSPYD